MTVHSNKFCVLRCGHTCVKTHFLGPCSVLGNITICNLGKIYVTSYTGLHKEKMDETGSFGACHVAYQGRQPSIPAAGDQCRQVKCNSVCFMFCSIWPIVSFINNDLITSSFALESESNDYFASCLVIHQPTKYCSLLFSKQKLLTILSLSTNMENIQAPNCALDISSDSLLTFLGWDVTHILSFVQCVIFKNNLT